MGNYLFRRIFLFVPTLIAISLLTFFISIHAPGDPVEMMLHRGRSEEASGRPNSAAERDYTELRNRLGLDLPLFYFSLTDQTEPDSLYRIADPALRETLKRLSAECGSWKNVSAYFLAVRKLETELLSGPAGSAAASTASGTGFLIHELKYQGREDKIQLLLHGLGRNGLLSGSLPAVQAAFTRLREETNPYKKYIPALHWYGFRNQYHHWLVRFISGDFGISYQDERPVSSSLSRALGKTLGISLLSILLAYGISIPLGVRSAVHQGSRKEKNTTAALYMLYSLPNFWIATLLVIFLCGGDYLSWFPAPGSPPIPDDAPLFVKFFEGSYRLILPLFCWTYGSLAFISRQMQGGIRASLTQDYIRTARAKGLDEKKIVWRHALRNSLLPVITLFADIFPLVISGSFVIETIFNIPGIGKLTLDALYARDYPVIFAVMMLTAILTMAGHLISDVLYALADPRISYTGKA